MSIPATQMRPGMIIKHNDQLHVVFSVEHRTPGNLRAFIQAKLKNVRTGAMFVERFRSPDPIDRVKVDEIKMEFLYSDGDDYYFMDEAFEQTVLKHETLGDAVEYLTPNLSIFVSFHDGKAVGIELPTYVEMTVMETEPGIKSATASSVTKPAKMETGLIVQVPPFINEGEKIRVDTAEGAYEPGVNQLMVQHFLVKGRVQGVGFRWFVHREAAEIGLRGWVRNTTDGDVEVLAAGEPDQLNDLLLALGRGSRGSRVDKVIEHELAESEGAALKTFEIEGAW